MNNFRLNLIKEAKNGLEQELKELNNSTTCQDSESLVMITNLINSAAGADIYTKDSEGFTVLHRLVEDETNLTPCQFHTIVQFLNTKNLSSIFNTPGEFTIIGKTNTSISYNFYMKYSTPFQLAVKKFEVENRVLTFFRENGIDFNSVDEEGQSVLHYAIFGHRSVELLSQLVATGADWRYANPQDFNWSYLHYAVVFGTIEQIKFFLDLGLDINTRDLLNFTPLHRATCSRLKNRLQVVQFLIENGADVKARTNFNKTPYGYLTYCSNPSLDKDKVAELLTQA